MAVRCRDDCGFRRRGNGMGRGSRCSNRAFGVEGIGRWPSSIYGRYTCPGQWTQKGSIPFAPPLGRGRDWLAACDSGRRTFHLFHRHDVGRGAGSQSPAGCGSLFGTEAPRLCNRSFVCFCVGMRFKRWAAAIDGRRQGGILMAIYIGISINCLLLFFSFFIYLGIPPQKVEVGTYCRVNARST